MPTLVLATGNPGKVREFAAALAELALEIVPQSAFGAPEVAETGLSFVENALLKARNAAHHTGLPALADDSGLVVDVLGGAPGIHSARYAGPGADDCANIAKLLRELRDVVPEKRTARFVCALTLLRHPADPLPLIALGTWEGRIALEPRGTNGFGYDPVFLPFGSTGDTAAELELMVKNHLSHRGQALLALRQQLRDLPGGWAAATTAPCPAIA